MTPLEDPTNRTEPGRSPSRPSVDVAGAKPGRHPWTWVLAVVVLYAAARLANTVIRNKNFDWPTVAHYFFNSAVLSGLRITIVLTVVAMVIGIFVGAVLVICRMSDNPVLASIASGYIWFFRGTPVLVQLIFWFNIALLIPTFEIGIPFGPSFLTADANKVITPILAAIIGLGLHEAAYQAEIYRAGLMSVDEGQIEAAKSLGMGFSRIFLTIQLPQAMRFIVPPTFSQIIGMVKGTALVSVIGGTELLFSVQQIYSQTFETIPLLVVACIWYLIVTSVLNVFQYFIERYYGRGSSRNMHMGVVEALIRGILPSKRAVARPVGESVGLS